MFRKDAIKLYVLGIAVLVLTGWAFTWQYDAEWKDYQADFRDMVAEKFGVERAELAPTGIQQIWLKDLDRVDRCTTCHLGVEWKGLENAPEPFRTHPAEILEKHPISKYGCTSCHGGQGFATVLPDAHGNVEHWEDSLMGEEVSADNLVKDSTAMMQTNCNVCHRYDRETKGATYINLAKQLVQKINCRACHTINGRGGTIGPDLTNEGDKAAEQFDYTRLNGRPSIFAWHVAHFQNPKMVSPDTVMPNFNLSTREAQALALLVMSWRRNTVPAHYRPGVQLRDVPTREEAEAEQRMLQGEGAFFVKKGCFTCHAVTSLGIDSAAKIGPDLSIAVVDVQSRFGRTLDDFLMEPTGTMSVVLSTQIPLTVEERLQAIQLLKLAYQRHQEKAAQTPSPSPSPAGK
jgi:mono/diheme cytochrome c family protein